MNILAARQAGRLSPRKRQVLRVWFLALIALLMVLDRALA